MNKFLQIQRQFDCSLTRQKERATSTLFDYRPAILSLSVVDFKESLTRFDAADVIISYCIKARN